MFLNALKRFNAKSADINLLSSSVIVSLKHVPLFKGTWLTNFKAVYCSHEFDELSLLLLKIVNIRGDQETEVAESIYSINCPLSFVEYHQKALWSFCYALDA